MKYKTIKNIILTIIVIGVGFALFTEIPTEAKVEASKMALEPPFIFIFMFMCLIAAIFLFWIMICVQIPQMFGGEQGKKEAKENLKKLDNLIDKLKFWNYFTKLQNQVQKEKRK